MQQELPPHSGQHPGVGREWDFGVRWPELDSGFAVYCRGKSQNLSDSVSSTLKWGKEPWLTQALLTRTHSRDPFTKPVGYKH